MLPRGLCLLLLVWAGDAFGAQSWDGTWTGGRDSDDRIQITIAGNKVTAVYRDGAYPEILRSDVSADGSMLIVWWIGGDGLLQRAGERDAMLALRERGRGARNLTVHLNE